MSELNFWMPWRCRLHLCVVITSLMKYPSWQPGQMYLLGSEKSSAEMESYRTSSDEGTLTNKLLR
jgi:hypothetical protein